MHRLLLIPAALLVLYLQQSAVQLLHDSCRLWSEPPPWARLCPPSTRHGASQ